MIGRTGQFSWSTKATISVPSPTPIPFTITIWMGFLSDRTRVKLFSRPQQKVARITRIDPQLMVRWLTSVLKTQLAINTNPTPSQSWRPTFSWKNKNARIVVATTSKFPNNDALAAVDNSIPIFIKIPARMLTTTTAIKVGISVLANEASFFMSGNSQYTNGRMIAMPTPVPMYNNADSVIGGQLCSTTLAIGGYSAYRSAERTAMPTAFLDWAAVKVFKAKISSLIK